MHAIKDAILLGNEPLVKKWISENKNGLHMMDEDGSTLLHYAAEGNQEGIAEFLLKKGANANMQDATGWTPFHTAASMKNFTICKVLLKNGSDPKIKNNSNSSGFLYLGRSNRGETPDIQFEVLNTCISKKKVDLDSRNALGETILHTACIRGSSSLISFFLERSCDPNAVNIRGENALYYAVRSGHPEFVSQLLEKGVNPRQISSEGKTALDEAKQCNIEKVIFVLQDFMDQNPVEVPWKTVPFFGSIPSKRSFHKLVLLNDTVWLFGGAISAVQYSAQIHNFTFNSPTWQLSISTTGSVPQMAGHTINIYDDSFIICGGRNAVQTSKEIFRLHENTWTSAAELLSPRCYHTATLINEKTVMLFGGSSNKGRDHFLSSVEYVDISGRFFCCTLIETVGTTPEPRINHSATLIDGKVFVWGGKGENGDVFNDLFIYDCKKDSWSSPVTSGIQPGKRFGHTANYLDGTLYIYGGFDSKKRATNSLFALQIEEMVWSEIQFDEVPPLASHDAIVYDNSIYFIGWDDEFQFLVFTPSHVGVSAVPNREPWQPAGEENSQTPKTKILASNQLQGSGVPQEDLIQTKTTKLKKKDVLDRIEKLENFSGSLTTSMSELIKLVEIELEKETPFADGGKLRQDIQTLCGNIQEFCVLERPPKSWTGTNSRKKHLSTLANKEEKIPFPLHHYANMKIPPKRITPPSLAKQENPTEEETILRNRNLVLNEIIGTETDYVRDLAVLVGLYERPLRDEYKHVVGPYELKNIFKNAEKLWVIHLKLLGLLQEEELKPVQEQCIGNIFLSMNEELKEYNTYCANQQTSSDSASKLLKENVKFRDIVLEIQLLEASNRQELYSYLLKPFQRICRYELLLRELVKQTPEDWEDKTNIRKAMHSINSIVSGANETKRLNDTMTAIFEIQDKLIVPAAHPELSHLHKFSYVCQVQGLLEIDAKKGKTKKAFVYLFSAMILLTTTKGGKLTVVDVFSVSKSSISPHEAAPKGTKKALEISCKESSHVFGSNQLDAVHDILKEFELLQMNE